MRPETTARIAIEVRDKVAADVRGRRVDAVLGNRRTEFEELLERRMSPEKLAYDSDVLSILLHQLRASLERHVGSNEFEKTVDPADCDLSFARDLVRRGAVAVRDTGRSFDGNVDEAVKFVGEQLGDDALTDGETEEYEMRLVALQLICDVIRHGHLRSAAERACFWYLTSVVVNNICDSRCRRAEDHENKNAISLLLFDGFWTVFTQNDGMLQFVQDVTGTAYSPDNMKTAILAVVDADGSKSAIDVITGH